MNYSSSSDCIVNFNGYFSSGMRLILRARKIVPFSVERFDTTFGLVPREPEDDEGAVETQPGDYMAFFEPWDSGDDDS